VPSRYVRFLLSLMPQKGAAELYNSIGFNKHGKTEFYRDIIHHMKQSDDLYVIAPGIKGMVMTVFTLPSFGVVFKVIKDRFDPPKQVTEEIVREKYRLVSRSDRAGRMADTQEYANFIFYRNRFSEELIAELQRVAPSKLWMDEKWIIIRHLYVERRMEPLNIYLTHAGPDAVRDAMDEYGSAIKQMAAANIFPGDMLLKNFGVTRHGRVVFYDYDEICPLTECNFRKIPEPRNEEDLMSGQPWYTVAESDVFPEEFRLFFSGNPVARSGFEAQHADLYDYRYWQSLQQRIRDGFVFDTFPYRRSKRFDPSRGQS
jgi:isocitrate dehydrogenase kinase/phosphatase